MAELVSWCLGQPHPQPEDTCAHPLPHCHHVAPSRGVVWEPRGGAGARGHRDLRLRSHVELGSNPLKPLNKHFLSVSSVPDAAWSTVATAGVPALVELTVQWGSDSQQVNR